MSQTSRLYSLLSDGLRHRTDEIVSKVYGNDLPLSRVGARIYDVKRRFKVEIESHRDREVKGLWWYRLSRPVSENTRTVVLPSLNTEGAGSLCECRGTLIKKESFGVVFFECFSCKSKKLAA